MIASPVLVVEKCSGPRPSSPVSRAGPVYRPSLLYHGESCPKGQEIFMEVSVRLVQARISGLRRPLRRSRNIATHSSAPGERH